MTSTRKAKVEKISFSVNRLYSKTVIDFNFRRQEDLSTLKSNIHLSLVALINITF